MRTQSWAKMRKNFCSWGGGKIWGAYFLNQKWPEAKTLQIFIIYQKPHFDEVSAKSERVVWEPFAVLTWNDPFTSYALYVALFASMAAAAYKICKFSIVKNSCCDVIVNMKMFPFVKLFIEIINNSQTKRVRDLKILPDLEQGLKIKISSFAKGNILRCSLLQNDGRVPTVLFLSNYRYRYRGTLRKYRAH